MEKFKKFAMNHSQMKNIAGGRWSCSCYGGPGTWSGNYGSPGRALMAIYEYCSGGGTCARM